MAACLNLVEKTSGKHYRESRQGWSRRRKRSEMGLWDLRYLVVREVEGGDGERKGEGEWEDVEGGGDGEARERKGEERDEEGGETAVEKTEKVEGKGNGKADEKGYIKGFMSFMPTFEDDIPVLYLYEIHLEDSLRGFVPLPPPLPLPPIPFKINIHPSNRTGLGTHLLTLLSHIASAIPTIQKIMLTCFIANEAAMKFYRKLGFERDVCNPEPRVLKGGRRVEADYVILSRVVGREDEHEGEEKEEGHGVEGEGGGDGEGEGEKNRGKKRGGGSGSSSEKRKKRL